MYYQLGQKVRVLGDSFDNVGGEIRAINRRDHLDDSNETQSKIWYEVETPMGNLTLGPDDITATTPPSKFATPEEAEAWLDEQAGKSWVNDADDWLKELTDGS